MDDGEFNAGLISFEFSSIFNSLQLLLADAVMDHT